VLLKWISKLSLTDARIQFFLFKETDKHPELLELKEKIPGQDKNLGEYIQGFSTKYEAYKGLSRILDGIDVYSAKRIKSALDKGDFKDKDTITSFANDIKDNEKKLFTDNMALSYRLDIIKDLAEGGFKDIGAIQAIANLFENIATPTYSRNYDEKKHNDIIQALAIQGFKDKEVIEAIGTLIKNNRHNMYHTNELILIIQNLAKGGLKDQKSIKAIGTLFKDNMDTKNLILIIELLLKRGSNDEKSIMSFVKVINENEKILFKKGTGVERRIDLLKSLIQVRFKSENVIKAIGTLFKDNMDTEDRIYIIEALDEGGLRDEKSITDFREAINENENILFIDGMGTYYRSRIISALASWVIKDEESLKAIGVFFKDMDQNDRYDTITALNKLFTKDMSASNRVAIINSLMKGGFRDKKSIQAFAYAISQTKNILFREDMHPDSRANVIQILAEEGVRDVGMIEKLGSPFME
jgi:hypothetical protein